MLSSTSSAIERRMWPEWLKKRYFQTPEARRTADLIAELDLNTVCQSALCPNISECFTKKTATFMIMGDLCTRYCRFCGVKKGSPRPLDPSEPRRVAEAVVRLKLKYVVITSVTRDDLPDGGAGHFAETVREIRAKTFAKVELLIPDFCGSENSIEIIADSKPDVCGHNLETVPRLYKEIRPRTDYKRSRGVLAAIKKFNLEILTKSGLMVGLGEREEEVIDVMGDLKQAGCDILTIGQYLSPTKANLPVFEFILPEQFKRYEDKARRMGFKYVASGPFVRSSYMAESYFDFVIGNS